MNPSIRKPIGVILLILIIAGWAVIVASFSSEISALPVWAQIPVYAVCGIVWILPLKPLLQWMETGTLTPPKA